MVLDPESRLVVLDVTHTTKRSFRVVVVYAPTGGGRADFFKNLERFLAALKTLLLFGDFIIVIDVRNDCTSSKKRRVNLGFTRLIESYSLVDRYRLHAPSCTMWIWSNTVGSSRSYLDSVICRDTVSFHRCISFPHGPKLRDL